MDEFIRKADVLIEALPYIRAFRGKSIVIKYGGSGMGNAAVQRGLLEDIVFMNFVGMHPVLVHGGGPEINQRLKARGLKIEFLEGLRVTDPQTMAVVEEALTEVNKGLVRQLTDLGAHAIGATPRRYNVVCAKPHLKTAQLGLVGEIERIDGQQLRQWLHDAVIPVVCPIGVGPKRQPYNINADEAASAIAAAAKAEKLVLLTDVRGILRNPEDPESLIGTLTVTEARELLQRGIIQAGMIPKMEACVGALKHGVRKTHIIDIKVPHALLLEIFTDRGIGTEIVRPARATAAPRSEGAVPKS